MAHWIKAALIFGVAIFTALPVFAKDIHLPGNVTILNNDNSNKENVVVDTDRTHLVIRTDPQGAKYLRRALNNSDQVIISIPPSAVYPQGYYDYPLNSYPYYTDQGTAYSAGHAVGTILSK